MDHKYELRHQDDNKLIAYGPTLRDFMKSAYTTALVPDIQVSNLYVNRVFLCGGEELNELFAWIAWGRDENDDNG